MPDTATIQDTATIHIVDDHRLVGDSLRVLFGVNGLEATVSACESPAAILDEVDQLHPAVVLMDLDLDAGGNGEDLVQPIVGLGATVVVLSGTTDRVRLARCVEAGAHSVISKCEPSDRVVAAVLAAVAGENGMSGAERQRMLADLDAERRSAKATTAPFERLTNAEAAVLRSIIQGSCAQQIAGSNWVSITTVRSQIRSILKKLDVGSQLAAVALAHECKWTGA